MSDGAKCHYCKTSPCTCLAVDEDRITRLESDLSAARAELASAKADSWRLREALYLARDVSVAVRNGTASAIPISPNDFIVKLNDSLAIGCPYCQGTGVAITSTEDGDEYAVRCDHPTPDAALSPSAETGGQEVGGNG